MTICSLMHVQSPPPSFDSNLLNSDHRVVPNVIISRLN